MILWRCDWCGVVEDGTGRGGRPAGWAVFHENPSNDDPADLCAECDRSRCATEAQLELEHRKAWKEQISAIKAEAADTRRRRGGCAS